VEYEHIFLTTFVLLKQRRLSIQRLRRSRNGSMAETLTSEIRRLILPNCGGKIRWENKGTIFLEFIILNMEAK
jgi:hypothetical protein